MNRISTDYKIYKKSDKSLEKCMENVFTRVLIYIFFGKLMEYWRLCLNKSIARFFFWVSSTHNHNIEKIMQPYAFLKEKYAI